MARAGAFIRGDRPPAYVSKATLAAELDAGESTFDEWVKSGVLPKPIRLPTRSVRWCWAEIEQSLASLRGGPEGASSDPFLRGVRHASKAKEDGGAAA